MRQRAPLSIGRQGRGRYTDLTNSIWRLWICITAAEITRHLPAPRKPEGVERKSAWLVGSGLASLAAACFLVRDGQMKGENIHILEELKAPRRGLRRHQDPTRGFVIRGGREMENHFECLWDLFRSIPSLEHPENSVLDEYYWLNKEDPNYSLCRATVDRGKDAHTDGSSL